MTSLRCGVARTAGEIADAQRVRWIVYGEEERLLPASVARNGREVEARDLDADTVHLVVYAGDQPVGTVRLLPARAGAGLELESTFQLALPSAPGFVAGEVTRYCVVRRHRGTAAARLLYLALAVESQRRGITHWFAAANLETASAARAARVYQAVRARDLVDRRFQAAPRRPLPVASRRSGERRATPGGPAGLDLPRALALFTGRMGARCLGAPAYDPYFKVFALPIVAEVPPVPAAGDVFAPPSVPPSPAAPGTPAHP